MNFDLFVEQLVRADDQVDRPGFELFQQLCLLCAGFIAREQLDRDRMALEALHRRQIMLPREHGRRHEDRRLLAREDALHHGAQRDLGLAEADVAAQQAVHRPVGLHILLDLRDAAQLILGLLIWETPPRTPAAMRRPPGRRSRWTLARAAYSRISPSASSLAAALARALALDQSAPPSLFSRTRSVSPAADVFGDQVERRRRHIQEIRSGERDLDEIALREPSTVMRSMPTNRPMPWCSCTTRSPGDQVGERLDPVAVRSA